MAELSSWTRRAFTDGAAVAWEPLEYKFVTRICSLVLKGLSFYNKLFIKKSTDIQRIVFQRVAFSCRLSRG